MSEKVKSRKLNLPDWQTVLFAVCFFAVMLIDWERTSGLLWRNSNRLVGIVIAVMSFSHMKVPKIRRIVYCICGILCLGFWVLISFSSFGIENYLLWDARLIALNITVCGCCFAEAIISMVKDKSYIRFVSKSFYKENVALILTFVFWILACFSSDTLQNALYSLIIFVLLILTPFSQEEKKKIITGMGIGIIAGFWAIQIFAYGFRPYIKSMMRYSGIYYNANMFDLAALGVLVISLSYIFDWLQTSKKPDLKVVLAIINAAAMISFIVMSIGRLSVVLAFFFAGAFFIFSFVYFKTDIKRVSATLGMCAVTLLLTFPAVFASVEYLPRILKHPISIQYDYEWVDLENKDNYVKTDEFIDEVLKRSKKLVTTGTVETTEIQYDKILDPDYSEDKEYASMTKKNSGIKVRFAIWKTFIKELNLNGHTSEEMVLFYSPYSYAVHPHNVFIYMAFVFGIPAGILFLALMIIFICGEIKNMVKTGTDGKKLALLGLTLLFTLFGLAEMSWQFGQYLWFVIMLLPALTQKIQTKEEDNPKKGQIPSGCEE